MKRLDVLGAVFFVLGVAACRRDECSSATTTTSAVVPVDTTTTAASPAPLPAAPAQPALDPSIVRQIEESAAAAAAATAAASAAAREPAGAPSTSVTAAAPTATSPVTVAPSVVPPRAENRGNGTNWEPPSTDNPASMYGYDRATGGPMRPGAASNPNTTSGADPRR